MFCVYVSGCSFVRLMCCLLVFGVGMMFCFSGMLCVAVDLYWLLLIVLLVSYALSVYVLSFILMFGFLVVISVLILFVLPFTLLMCGL